MREEVKLNFILQLRHEGNAVREFYTALEGPAVVGIGIRLVVAKSAQCKVVPATECQH